MCQKQTRLIGILGPNQVRVRERGRKKVNLDCRYQAKCMEKVLGYFFFYIRNLSFEKSNNDNFPS
jgi:hypothetical protein